MSILTVLLGALGALSVFSAIGGGVMKGMLFPGSWGLGVSRGKKPKLKYKHVKCILN